MPSRAACRKSLRRVIARSAATWQSDKKSSVFAGNDVKNETNPQDCTRKGYAASVRRQSRQRLRSGFPSRDFWQGSGSGSRRAGFLQVPRKPPQLYLRGSVVQPIWQSAASRRLLVSVGTSNQQLSHTSKKAAPKGLPALRHKTFFFCRARHFLLMSQKKMWRIQRRSGAKTPAPVMGQSHRFPRSRSPTAPANT